MTNETQLIEKAIESIKTRIGQPARKALSDADVNVIKLILHEALTVQKSHVIEMLESVVSQLRAQTDRPEREL